MTTSQNGTDGTRDTEGQMPPARRGMVAAIGEARGRLGLTKTEVGKRAGVARNTNLNYLNGERAIPAELLFDYARALEMSAGELVNRAAELMEDR